MLFVPIVVSMEINRRHYFRSGPRTCFSKFKSNKRKFRNYIFSFTLFEFRYKFLLPLAAAAARAGYSHYQYYFYYYWGTQELRHCDTTRKVAGSMTFGFFIDLICTMRYFLMGEGGQCLELTTFNLLEP